MSTNQTNQESVPFKSCFDCNKIYPEIEIPYICCNGCKNLVCTPCKLTHPCQFTQEFTDFPWRRPFKFKYNQKGLCICLECFKLIPDLPRLMRFCFTCERHTQPIKLSKQYAILDDKPFMEECEICLKKNILEFTNDCDVCKKLICSWCFDSGQLVVYEHENITHVILFPEDHQVFNCRSWPTWQTATYVGNT